MEKDPLDEVCTRRDFFKKVFTKCVRGVSDVVLDQVSSKAKRQDPRPPGALEELEFLLSCTRCDKCVAACPEDVIELYGPEAGVLMKTPYLSFRKGGCAWCEDFPCIGACEDGALKSETPSAVPQPIAQLQVNLDHCLITQGQHCDYCKKACPKHIESAIHFRFPKPPEVDTSLCVGCGECVYLCVSQTGPVFSLTP